MKSEERRVKKQRSAAEGKANSIALLIIKFKTQGNHKVQCSKFKVQSKMIKIQNLKKIYNGNTVLDIDNLGVAKGELIGLVGNIELIMYPRILLSGISERFREYIFRKGRKKEL